VILQAAHARLVRVWLAIAQTHGRQVGFAISRG
jgi:hypothetical protein